MVQMTWSRLLNASRAFHEQDAGLGDSRSQFHKDHDRIVFSSAFRRLGRKTQVHPLSLNDHIHTRLTHSIEVGSVGRSLGLMVGDAMHQHLPDNISAPDIAAIVQAACLAHDIGHPPFGHAGEYAIRDFFQRKSQDSLLRDVQPDELRDLCLFESNAMALRVVTQTEYHQFAGGMRLTYATLATLMKYPWTAQFAGEKQKFGTFLTEQILFNEIAEKTGLLSSTEQCYVRHPLSFLLEAADDICYTILDLEDALELGILHYDEVEEVILQLCGLPDAIEYGRDERLSPRRRISALRGRAMQAMLLASRDAFVARHEAILCGQYHGELLLDAEGHVARGVRAGKSLAQRKVFRNARKSELEIGAFSTLGTLLDVFCHAVHEQHHREQVSFRSRRVLDLMGANAPERDMSMYQAYMRVLDYVGGMTDNYATYLAHQIGGMAH